MEVVVMASGIGIMESDIEEDSDIEGGSDIAVISEGLMASVAIECSGITITAELEVEEGETSLLEAMQLCSTQ